MRIVTAASRAAKSAGQPFLSAGRVSRRTLQERLARQAAIERAKARYLRLECGHMSTLEVDELYSNWRPKRGLTWCENCSDWVAIAQPPAPPEYPAEPLF